MKNKAFYRISNKLSPDEGHANETFRSVPWIVFSLTGDSSTKAVIVSSFVKIMDRGGWIRRLVSKTKTSPSFMHSTTSWISSFSPFKNALVRIHFFKRWSYTRSCCSGVKTHPSSSEVFDRIRFNTLTYTGGCY